MGVLQAELGTSSFIVTFVFKDYSERVNSIFRCVVVFGWFSVKFVW